MVITLLDRGDASGRVSVGRGLLWVVSMFYIGRYCTLGNSTVNFVCISTNVCFVSHTGILQPQEKQEKTCLP